jgi:DNA primase
MSIIVNDEIIEKVCDSNDLVSIVSEYLPLKKTGNNYIGLCPFHNEKTPSFSVSQSKQLFHCFGCGEGGDVISFIMKIENLSFVEAVKFLADRQGIPLEENKKIDKKLESEKEKIYKINKEAARFYYYNLINNKRPLRYLKNRKINRSIINQFGLGYSLDRWDGIYKYLKEKGYDEKDIEKAGLIGKRKDGNGYYDKFRDRIMFPIIDTRGRIIGFGGRVLDNTMPKYLNSQDTLVFAKGNNLYGLNLLRKHSNRKRIILVEGYMDVISLFNNGINYSVASLGTAFTQNQGKLLKRYGEEVYICYDSDKAGINATIKALNILKNEGVEAKVVILPLGQDPDDFIKSNGLKEFEILLDKALNYVEYKIFINKQKYDLSNAEDKIKFTKEIAKTLRELKSPIEKDVYIDKISEDTGISKQAILGEILGTNYKNGKTIYKDKYINAKYRDNKSKIMPIKNILDPAHLTAEKTLLKLMMENRNYYNMIKDQLAKEDFLNYECNIIANIIFNEYRGNSQLIQIDSQFILERLKNHDNNIDYTIINDIINRNFDFLPEDKVKLVEDLVKTIEYSKLKIKRKELTKLIQEIESKKDKDEGDVDKFKSLCLELTELDRKIKSYI